MLPKFATQKNPGLESFKPKKILLSSLSLEIRSVPPRLGNPLQATSGARYRRYILQDFDSVSSSALQPTYSI